MELFTVFAFFFLPFAMDLHHVKSNVTQERNKQIEVVKIAF